MLHRLPTPAPAFVLGSTLSKLAFLFLRADCFHTSFEEDVFHPVISQNNFLQLAPLTPDSLLPLKPHFAACHSVMLTPTGEAQIFGSNNATCRKTDHWYQVNAPVSPVAFTTQLYWELVQTLLRFMSFPLSPTSHVPLSVGLLGLLPMLRCRPSTGTRSTAISSSHPFRKVFRFSLI